MIKPKRLTGSMTGAQFQAFLNSFGGDNLDLRGLVVTVDDIVTLPARNWKIRGGKFVRGSGMTSAETMMYIGRGDLGSNNTYLDTLTAASLGGVAAGATSVTGSAIAGGWYVAYGSLNTGSATLRDSVTHKDGSFTHYVKAELVLVTGHSGGAIQFGSPLTRTYGNLKLSPLTPMFGVKIEGMEFDGYNAGVGGVEACLCVGPCIGLSITNCKFQGYVTKGLNLCICRDVYLGDVTVATDNGATLRYGIELGRCTNVQIARCACPSGRYGVTGQGTYCGRCWDSYFRVGADFDHGCGGKDLGFINCNSDGSVAFWNCGNSSYFLGSEVTFWNMTFKHPTPATTSAVVYVYPNATFKCYNSTLDQIKSSTYPTGSSGFTGDQGPNAITVGAGTVIERGNYGTHATATGPGGGDLIQFAYNDVVYAANSKLGSFTLEAGAVLKCCTFAAPIRAEGLVGNCTFTIAGEIWLQWVNTSVPCILVNNGSHTINLSSGFIMGNTQTSQPSASMDAVRVNSGVSGCSVNRGSNAILKWSGGQTTLSPMGADRVNDVSGLATIL